MVDYKLDLDDIPKKRPIVIEGFPGFGLVGTIVTEFLIDHLKCENIGKFYFEHLPSTVAIHKGKMVAPITVYYNKKHNLILIHSITAPMGIEWKAADAVLDICRKLKASQLISVEGVSSGTKAGKKEVLFYSKDKKIEAQLRKAKLNELTEGIVVGVTSALLMKSDLPLLCLFAESQANLPDAKAAASVISVLDSILGLKVDPKPLRKQAEEFEKKLKALLSQAKQVEREQGKRKLSYVG